LSGKSREKETINKQEESRMNRFLDLAVGVFLLIGFTSSAEAAIKIKVAEVQNGTAFIQGSAEKKSPVTWENQLVTTTNPGGQFSFNGVVPADCVGTLSDGVSTIDVAVLDCTPVSAALAPVPRTGQTTSYAAGDDGALQKGVAWPNPRFTDNNNGTITDNLTGLIWLKNANCIDTLNLHFPNDPGIGGRVFWQHALDFVAGINAGTYDCSDTSNGGSHQTDWRLPNLNELRSLLDQGTHFPALPLGHPFTGFDSNDFSLWYWSSTTVFDGPGAAWGVGFAGGDLFAGADKNGNTFFVIAVRGGS
jgi:hypothetical protein